MRIALIALVALSGLTFAAGYGWMSAAGAALILSVMFLGLLMAFGKAFNVNELELMAKEEFYQVLVTGLMIGIFLGAQGFFDGTLSPIFGIGGASLQQSALTTIQSSISQQEGMYTTIKDYSINLGQQSTKSSFCTMSGIGFNIAPCNGFSALMTPLSVTTQALSLSLAELSSLYALIAFGNAYAFSVLLPIGILLRTFKATRGASGLMIGLAASLYLFLPLAAVFMDGLTSTIPYPSPNLGNPSCDVGDFGTMGTSINYDNADAATNSFNNLKDNLSYFLYLFLIRGTITSIVCLLAMYASLKAISKLAGAEVDISGLMRVS